MIYNLRKTVVIGLGGTGMHATLHMKRKLLNTFGEIPPMIKFLVLDTTDSDTLNFKDGEYRLDPGEFLKMEVRNPKTLIKNSREVRDWLPDDVPKYAILNGAKQIRPLGRLSIFANLNPVEEKIENVLNSVRDFKVGRYQDKYELISDNIFINIVTSIAGGTGAGCFLDIATIIKKRLTDSDRVMGFILLPDVFTSKPATHNVQPNAFAALKELNYFYIPNSKYVYTLGGVERTMEEGLFDIVFLINNINSSGITYNKPDELEEFIGNGMYLLSSKTGKKTTDIIDNVEASTLSEKWYGKPTVFSSFGIGELVYPGEWYADLYAKQIALDVIQKTFMGGEVTEVNEAVENYIDQISIREDTASEVIDSILPPDHYSAFPLPKNISRDIIDSTFDRVKLHLNNAQREFIEVAKENLTSFKDRKVEDFNQYISQRLSKPQENQYCQAFLASFIGRMIEFKNILVEQKEEYQNRTKNFDNTCQMTREEAKRASKRLLGRNAAIEKILRNFKKIVDQQVLTHLEIERRDEAIEFFTHMIDLARDWLDNLKTLSRYCTAIIQELNQEIQKEKFTEKTIKPFVEEIKTSELTNFTPNIEPHDFLNWLHGEKNLSIYQLTDKKLTEFKNILLDYGYLHEKVKEIKEKSINEVLQEMPAEKRKEYISLLDKIAVPLWQYDPSYVVGKYKTDNIYLFGVEAPEDSVIKPEEITSALHTPYDPSIIGTGDNKSVICFKVESAIPAFILNKMPEYRDKYLDPDRPFNYHIHKDWEVELPSLFPTEGEEENIVYFALASIPTFNLIKKVGVFYYAYSEKKGERANDYWLKLAQGRSKAMKAFIQDSELVDEVRERIEREIQNLGNTRVQESLTEYIKQMQENITTGGTKIVKDQITLELNVLERYLNLLKEE